MVGQAVVSALPVSDAHLGDGCYAIAGGASRDSERLED